MRSARGAHWPRWLIAGLLAIRCKFVWFCSRADLISAIAGAKSCRKILQLREVRARAAQGGCILRLVKAPVQNAISERPPAIIWGVCPVQACACLWTCLLRLTSSLGILVWLLARRQSSSAWQLATPQRQRTEHGRTGTFKAFGVLHLLEAHPDRRLCPCRSNPRPLMPQHHLAALPHRPRRGEHVLCTADWLHSL